MSLTSLESTFVINPFTSTFNPKRKSNNFPPFSASKPTRCSIAEDKDSSSNKINEGQVVKLAMVTLAAGVLALGSVDSASAAKTGGRVGGQAFRSSAPPRSSSPRINNSRGNDRAKFPSGIGTNTFGTNIYINPRVAPPLVGGYGYGYGVPFYGGWGWSPFSFFAPGPGVAVGVGGGFDVLSLFLVLGAVSAVIRRFLSSRRKDDDDDVDY